MPVDWVNYGCFQLYFLTCKNFACQPNLQPDQLVSPVSGIKMPQAFSGSRPGESYVVVSYLKLSESGKSWAIKKPKNVKYVLTLLSGMGV